MDSTEFRRIADANGLTPKKIEPLICFSGTSWAKYRRGAVRVPERLVLFMRYVDRYGPVTEAVERRSEQLFTRQAFNAAREDLPPSLRSLVPESSRVHAVEAVCLALVEAYGVL
jgi:hypothetical protein